MAKIPKWMGFIPNLGKTGRKIGMRIISAGSPSKTDPRIKKVILHKIRNMIGELEMKETRSPIFWGI